MRTTLSAAACAALLAAAGCGGATQDLRCGAGTHEEATQCVPDLSLSCGPGTHVEAGACVADADPVTCGDGTRLSNGECVPSSTLTCGPGTHVQGSECVLDAESLSCGAGTHASGTMCLADLSCGAGTHAAAGLCVPDQTLTCGPGTHAVANACVRDAAFVSCGPGTHLANGACLPDSTLACGPGTHVQGTQCVVDSLPLSCGTGTHASGTTCVPDVTCGPGTHEASGLCVPDRTLTCGPGTHVEGGACVLDAAPVACGPGTHLSDGGCVPDAILSCGPGTHVEADLCVPDAIPLGCGPGTRVDGTTCVPDGAYFDVRAIVSGISADGRTKIQVLAIGRNGDGTPATDEVLVVPDRPSAGTFPGAFALDPMGSVTYFTPCAATAPDCLGPTTFRLVRASDPSVVLATTGPLELVAPTGVGSPAACLVGGNVLFVDADSWWVWQGIVDIRVAHWALRTGYDANGAPTWLFFEIYPFDVSQGERWFVTFGPPSDGIGLHTGVFEDATAFGLDISADSYACGENTGRFEVQELVVENGALRRFTATFQTQCGRPTDPMDGCLHWEAP